MGHERVGVLPKTKKWSNLVRQVYYVYSSDVSIESISAQTLKNVRSQYERLGRDDAVKNVFSFFVRFARAFQAEDVTSELSRSGIYLPENPTILSIVKNLRNQIPQRIVSTENGQITLAAAADAIGQWYKNHSIQQISLFKPTDEFYENWRKLGSGSGFCELSRLFFGRLTERYLNYFLDRAASATLETINQRERFRKDVQTHIDDISKHAFETAMITQSFAAGWFNAHARKKMPNEKEIEGFLSIAFGKMRDELRREEEAK